MVKKRVSDERGMTIVLVVGVVLVLTVLGFAVVRRASDDYTISKKNIEGTRALHVADAGIQQAVWRIKQNMVSSTSTTSSFDIALDDVNGTGSVTISKDTGSTWYWTITSIGRVGTASKKVKVTLFNFSLWDVDMSTGGGMTGGSSSGAINGNASFTGPLYVQGGFGLSGSATYSKGPLIIYDGSLQLGGSAEAGSAELPIEAYIHPASGYPPCYRLGNPDSPIIPDPIHGPFYCSKFSTDAPKITLPPLESMYKYRLDAYNASVYDTNYVTTDTVHPQITQFNKYLGQYGEKIFDNNDVANTAPTGNSYTIDSSTRLFGFDSNSQQIVVNNVNAFAWNPGTSTLYLSQTGQSMTIYVDGDLTLGSGSDMYFQGKGTIVVNGNLTIKGRLGARNRTDFPATSCLGLVVNGVLTADQGGGNADNEWNTDYQGAWYGKDKIFFTANNVGFKGTLVTQYLEIKQNAHCWTADNLSSNLPPSLPGANTRMTLISGWKEITKP